MFPKWIELPSSVRGNAKRLHAYLEKIVAEEYELKKKGKKATAKKPEEKKEEVDADAKPQKQEK